MKSKKADEKRKQRRQLPSVGSVSPIHANKKEHEQLAIEWAKIPRITELGPGGFSLEPGNDESLALFKALLKEITGTVDENTAFMLLSQAALVSCDYGSANFASYCTAALSLIYGIAPRDSIEGMLAVQMVGTHSLAMKFLERSLSEEQTIEQANENINRATKLLRLYTTQMEALNSYRNKGKQKVTVEHIYIGPGGQAIVGNVEHRPRGRG